MKTIILSACALLLANALFAQNWSPINTEETFYYNSNNEELTGIRVESIALVEGDTVWFTNLFARLHPDLEAPTLGCETESTITTVVAGFLQSEVVQLEGGVYLFQNPDTFLIHSQAALGDEWVYSEMWGEDPVTATVLDMAEIEVLGAVDSAKTIALSDGRILILTKNHGCIEFESAAGELYTLSGIPDRQLGEYPIGRHEIFDFEEGDVFVFLFGGGYSELIQRGVMRIEILSVSENPDETIEVTYQHAEYRRVWQMVNDNGVFYHVETNPVILSSQQSNTISHANRNASDAVLGTLFTTGMDFQDNPTWINFGIGALPYAANVHYEEINGRTVKVIGSNNSFSESAIAAAQNIDEGNSPYTGNSEDDLATHQFFYNDFYEMPNGFALSDSTLLNTQVYGCPSLGHYSYAQGLGYVSVLDQTDLYWSSTTMVGYRKDTEEFGYVPTAAEVLSVGINEVSTLPKVTVYPVPTVDELFLSPHDAQTYRIFDISGKPVLQGSLLGASVIDVSNLAAGMYNGHLLRDDQPTGQFRFVKMK